MFQVWTNIRMTSSHLVIFIENQPNWWSTYTKLTKKIITWRIKTLRSYLIVAMKKDRKQVKQSKNPNRACSVHKPKEWHTLDLKHQQAQAPTIWPAKSPKKVFISSQASPTAQLPIPIKNTTCSLIWTNLSRRKISIIMKLISWTKLPKAW